MQRNYQILAENVRERINPENFRSTEDFSREIATISYSDVLKYVRFAMTGVDPEYTKRSKQAGENVKGHLSALSDATFNYQGSVMTNTHIRASSDIDLLVLTSKYFYFDRYNIQRVSEDYQQQQSYFPNQIQLLKEEANTSVYSGDTSNDLRKLRLDSEDILKREYSICDTTHAKAIKIHNKGLRRDVDVVIANYYDDITSVINKKGSYRGIQVYNKELHQRGDADYPFLSIERINQRGLATVGRIKKMIRFLKNMKAKSDHDIILSSFDFNAICYDINPATYSSLEFYKLVPIIYRQLKSLADNSAHANALMSVDGREPIFRTRPDKLDNLRFILSETEAVYQDLLNVPSLILS